MKLNAKLVNYIEVDYIPNILKKLGDNCFYRETYTEFDTYIYFPKSSLTDCDNEFRRTEIYAALKEVFDAYPEHTDLHILV